MGNRIVKTTIDLTDALAKKAKRLAKRNGQTLRAVIEDGIRLALRESEGRKSAFKLKDGRVHGKGLQPGFETASWSDIRGAAYSGRGD
jgi:hypothetical protein